VRHIHDRANTEITQRVDVGGDEETAEQDVGRDPRAPFVPGAPLRSCSPQGDERKEHSAVWGKHYGAHGMAKLHLDLWINIRLGARPTCPANGFSSPHWFGITFAE
jgi:hypothetical protein